MSDITPLTCMENLENPELAEGSRSQMKCSNQECLTYYGRVRMWVDISHAYNPVDKSMYNY